MATLNLNTDEFADIAMIWLFDHVMNPEQIKNDEFKEFIENHRSKIKTALMKYYLDSDSETRLKYKRIKGIFDGSDKAIQQIRIGPSEKIEKEKKKSDIVKKVLKKILTKEEITKNEIEILKEYVNYE